MIINVIKTFFLVASIIFIAFSQAENSTTKVVITATLCNEDNNDIIEMGEEVNVCFEADNTGNNCCFLGFLYLDLVVPGRDEYLSNKTKYGILPSLPGHLLLTGEGETGSDKAWIGFFPPPEEYTFIEMGDTIPVYLEGKVLVQYVDKGEPYDCTDNGIIEEVTFSHVANFLLGKPYSSNDFQANVYDCDTDGAIDGSTAITYYGDKESVNVCCIISKADYVEPNACLVHIYNLDLTVGHVTYMLITDDGPSIMVNNVNYDPEFDIDAAIVEFFTGDITNRLVEGEARTSHFGGMVQVGLGEVCNYYGGSGKLFDAPIISSDFLLQKQESPETNPPEVTSTDGCDWYNIFCWITHWIEMALEMFPF